jgi:hypothetical protein
VKRARFKVLRLANSPSVLVEGGFMSNPREASLLRTEEYRQQVADWIFKGIMAYRKSQDTSPAPSRLSVEKTEKLGKVSASTPELRPIMNLQSVPAFKPKAVGSNTPVSATQNPNATVSASQPDATNGEVRRAIPVAPTKKAE